MSFDLNEAVFDSEGSYLEEKAVRYEHTLMDQFAASPEGQAIKERGTEKKSYLASSRGIRHHGERRRSGDHPRITCILAVSPACLPVAAGQADAGTLDAASCPRPGASVAGPGHLWHGQVLCPYGKGGRL